LLQKNKALLFKVHQEQVNRDYIARGKKVLFICEKRAAIDVVYYRLKQQGLDRLCCRIHDSQSDKKSFVMDLKDSYEQFLAGGPNLNTITKKREEIITQLDQELSVLNRFSETMNQTHDGVQIPLHELINRLIELKTHQVDLTDEQLEILPEYGEWLNSGKYLTQLTDVLKELGENDRFALHPVSTINENILKTENPVNRVNDLLKRVDQQIDALIQELDEINIEPVYKENLNNLLDLCNEAERIGELARTENLNLLDKHTDAYQKFIASIEEIRLKRSKLKKEKKDTVNWKEKLSETDLKNALWNLSSIKKIYC